MIRTMKSIDFCRKTTGMYTVGPQFPFENKSPVKNDKRVTEIIHFLIITEVKYNDNIA